MFVQYVLKTQINIKALQQCERVQQAKRLFYKLRIGAYEFYTPKHGQVGLI